MKKILISLFISLGLIATPALLPAAVGAETPKEAACSGLALTGGGNNCENPEGTPTVDSTITLVINIMSILVGFASVLMIIIGGFKYVTSSGDPAGVSSAKNTILFAVIGLVIVALAQVIVRFVINEATAPPSKEKSSVILQQSQA